VLLKGVLTADARAISAEAELLRFNNAKQCTEYRRNKEAPERYWRLASRAYA